MVTRVRREIVTVCTFYGVALLNTLIDVALFYLLSRAGVAYLVAQVLSYGTGALNSYVLNRAVTFGRRGHRLGMEPVRFGVVNALSLTSAAAVLYVVHSASGGDLWLGKAAATVVGAVLNYLGNRVWVFGDTASSGGVRVGR